MDFKVYQKCGSEIKWAVKPPLCAPRPDNFWLPKNASEDYIYGVDEIKVGDEVFAPICDFGWYKVKIVKKDGKTAYAEGTGNGFGLKFGEEEDRQCWVCSYVINLKALEKVEF
jgi:hypothetical protein